MSTPLPPPIYEYEVCFRASNKGNLLILTDRAIILEDLPKWIIATPMDGRLKWTPDTWDISKKVAIRTKDIMYLMLVKVKFPGREAEE